VPSAQDDAGKDSGKQTSAGRVDEPRAVKDSGKQTPPPASLRLLEVEAARVKAGQEKMVPLRSERQNLSGTVRVVLAEQSRGVTVHGQVDEGKAEGSLKVVVAAGSTPGGRDLHLRASNGTSSASGNPYQSENSMAGATLSSLQTAKLASRNVLDAMGLPNGGGPRALAPGPRSSPPRAQDAEG